MAAVGDATNDPNTSAIYDSTTPGATFEYTEFTNPTNSLTINRGRATDNLTVLDLVTSGLNAGLTIVRRGRGSLVGQLYGADYARDESRAICQCQYDDQQRID